MKTTKVNEFVTVCHHDKTEMYTVIIDNETKKVIKYHCQFTRMDKRGIQDLVDNLIKEEMITIFGESTTEVHINIWDIDESNELYIETFHRDPTLPDNELFDDYDRIMNYKEFIDSCKNIVFCP